MAYKEKLAWLTLGAMLIAYALYFALLATRYDLSQQQSLPIMPMLLLFAGITIVQAIIVAVISAVIAVRARRAGEDRPDERDRAIARRGSHIAYFVLMVAIILVGVIMPLGQDPRWKIANAALLALVIAEATRYILIILSYRRGWHG